jgi:hypothetical protein
MPRIGSTPRAPQGSAVTTPPAVKAETKKTLKAAFETALKSGELEFHASGMPAGQRYVRVPLKSGRGADQFSYTALVPVGALAPNTKALDPNKAKSFFVERSGGLAGVTMVAGPVTMGARGKVTVEPFFNRFLEGQDGGRRGAVTEKAPSDHEDGNGRLGGGARVGTEKYPSDNEDGGGGRVDGGNRVGTEKYPSDNEDGGGGRVNGGGRVGTEKYPSDNEDGGGGRVDGGNRVGTEKYPSDNEDGGGGRVDGGNRVGTEKYPSDNEDGGGGGRIGGRGRAVTEKFPSDADE